MQLECKIRRAGGTVVDMPNGEGEPDTRYTFAPLDPTRADSPHVADVTNAAHRDRFLAAGVYVPFAAAAPVAPLAKPAIVADLAASAMAAVAYGAAADKAADDDADTNNDGRLSIIELATGIADGKFDHAELRALRDAEQASPAPRKGFINAINKALKS